MRSHVPLLVDGVGRWINQDGEEPREIIRFTAQQQKTGLRRDDHANFVCDNLASAAFEPLFRQENLHMAEQLVLVVRRKSLQRKRPIAQR